MRIGKIVARTLLTTGVILALFAVLMQQTPLAQASDPFVHAPQRSFIERIFDQIHGVASFTAQTIGAVLSLNAKSFASGATTTPAGLSTVGKGPFASPDIFSPSIGSFTDEGTHSLLVNVPLSIANNLSVNGVTDLSTTTVHRLFVSSGKAVLGSLVVQSSAQVQNLSVSGATNLGVLHAGASTLGTLSVLAGAEVAGSLQANGGIQTNGADVNAGSGKVYAANIINSIKAGSNISISGTANDAVISAEVPVYGTPSLASVRAVGGCPECITDSDVVPSLTISGGLINNTTIGLSTAAAAAFTDVHIGTTTATSTLTVSGRLVVSGSASSTFDGGINVTNGCVAVNGVCLGGGVSVLNDLTDVTVPSPNEGDVLLFDGTIWKNVATSSLGFSAASYLSLSDTPSSFIANTVPFTNASGTALTASSSFVFDGTHLGIGTSTPERSLSIGGDMRLTGAFYDSSNSAGSNGYVLQSTATGQHWVATSSLGINTPWNISGTKIYYNLGNVGIGTSSPSEKLSVAGGNIGLFGQQSLRFYSADNSHYVGFKATTTIASNVTWTLPGSDGNSNELLVTDGSGHLRFANVGSVGGGSATYLGLSDTPSSFISKTIPFTNVAATALTDSSSFVFDGSRLGIGTNAPTSTLTVQGSVSFQSGTTTSGLYYSSLSNQVGIGTTNPSSKFTVEGGSIAQRGASSGGFYVPKQLSSLSLPDNATNVFVIGSYAYVTTAGSGNDFHIIDISDSSAPVEVGSLNLSDGANAVYVSGRYAYVVTNLTGNDFHIIDISSPQSPVEVGGISLPTTASDVVVQGKYAYVTTTGTGNDVHVIDVSNPLSPVEVGSLNLPNGATGIAVNGNYAYISTNAASGALYVVNISTSTSPAITTSLDLSAPANDVAIQGKYAYVTTSGIGNDLHVVSISNPAAPSEVGSLNLVTNASAVAVSGRYAYISTTGTGDDFHVINISAPTAPVEVGSTELASGAGLGVAVAGNRAYMVTSAPGDNFHVMDITGLDVQSAYVDSLEAGTVTTVGNIQIAGGLTIAKGLRAGISGLQTDGSLFAQGSESSYIGGKLGIGTSTPSQMLTVVGGARLTGAFYDSLNSAGLNGMILQSTATGQHWVATSSLGLGGGGSSLFTDSGATTYLTSLSDNLAIGTTSASSKLTVWGGSITQVASGNPALKGTYDTSGGAFKVAVSGKYAYVADYTSGLEVIDISNPAAPSLVGSYDTPGSAYGVFVSSKYAYVADGTSGLEIIDVSNPSSPSLVGTYNTPGSADSVVVSSKYAYVADGTSGLEIIDVSNPSSPSLVGTYNTPGSAQDVTISGKYAYVADYGSGLEIIDVSNPSSPSLVGSYDTPGNAVSVVVSGKYAYVADYGSGLEIIDVSNPSSPSLVGTYNTPGSARGVFVSGKYAYVADSTTVQIINISNSVSPSLVGLYDTPGNNTESVTVSGKYAYVADFDFGIEVVDVNGAEFPSMFAGDIETDQLNVNQSSVFGGDIYAQGGLNVGLSGIFSRGSISSASSISSATGTSVFMGSVNIGTASASSFKLQVAGNVGPNSTNNYNLGAAGSNWGCLYYNNSTIGTCASDQRLKTNIRTLSFDNGNESALSQLSKLQLHSFAYKTATSSIYHGLIAQEVQQFSPELVEEDASTTMLSVKYGDVQWLTIQAVQELNRSFADILAHGSTTATSSFGLVLAAHPDSIWSRLVALARNFTNGILTTAGIHSQEITTDKLCVGATCVTEDQFKTMLQDTGNISSGSNTSSSDTTVSDVPALETASSTSSSATSSPSTIVDTESASTTSDNAVSSTTPDAEVSTENPILPVTSDPVLDANVQTVATSS